MKFVQRKVTTAKSKHIIADFTWLKEQFLQDVVVTVEMEEIPPELILNWDQTGIKQHLDYESTRCQASGGVWS